MDVPVAQEAAPTEPGDPAWADDLAARAEAVAGTDSEQALRLLIAASVVAPNRVNYRHKLAQWLLTNVKPTKVTAGSLGRGSPVTYAAMTADADFVVVERTGGAQVWRTYNGMASRVEKAKDVGGPVTVAAGALSSRVPDLLLAGQDGVVPWIASLGLARSGVRFTDHADLVAMTIAGDFAVTVGGASATLWRPDMFASQALATLSYDATPTAAAFAPGNDLVLAVGHDDGAVTLDRIDQQRMSTNRQHLVGDGASVTSLAVSADGLTVLTVSEDGALSVWNVRRATQPVAVTGTAKAAGHGPYNLWLSPTGDIAVVSDTTGAPAVWSLADTAAPTHLLDLDVDDDPKVPAMTTHDGRRLVTIDQDNTLSVWDTSSIVDTLTDPVPRACAAVALTDATWRELVPDPAYANPCPPTGLPALDGSGSER